MQKSADSLHKTCFLPDSITAAASDEEDTSLITVDLARDYEDRAIDRTRDSRPRATHT